MSDPTGGVSGMRPDDIEQRLSRAGERDVIVQGLLSMGLRLGTSWDEIMMSAIEALVARDVERVEHLVAIVARAPASVVVPMEGPTMSHSTIDRLRRGSFVMSEHEPGAVRARPMRARPTEEALTIGTFEVEEVQGINESFGVGLRSLDPSILATDKARRLMQPGVRVRIVKMVPGVTAPIGRVSEAKPMDLCPSCNKAERRTVVARFVTYHCAKCWTDWTVDTETDEVSS